MIEKIFIFDAGLDDRIVEVLKLLLIDSMAEDKKEAGELRFERVEEENEKRILVFVILGEDIPRRTGLPIAAYDDLATNCAVALSHAGDDGTKYLRVDVNYATSLLTPRA